MPNMVPRGPVPSHPGQYKQCFRNRSSKGKFNLFIDLFIHHMYQQVKRFDLHVDDFDLGPDTKLKIN